MLQQESESTAHPDEGVQLCLQRRALMQGLHLHASKQTVMQLFSGPEVL